jgi:hypothetical protein
LGLVERRDPALAPLLGRQGRYYLCDPMLRFYYRFIVPNITAIEHGMLTPVAQRILDDLPAFIGAYTFVDLCREWVWIAAAHDNLGFIPETAGAYWGRSRGKGVQLDVVAASRREKRLFIAEARWAAGAMPRGNLSDLVSCSQRMPQVKAGWQVEYGLFARAGFTPAARAEAGRIGARLVGLEELEQALVDTATRSGTPLPDTELEF